MPASDLDSTGLALRRSMLPGGGAGEIDGVGVYATDGVFLYRVIGIVPSEEDDLVELEDCYGLDVVRVAVADFNARRLRAVTGAGPMIIPSSSPRRARTARSVRHRPPSRHDPDR